MKKILLTAVALSALMGSAIAADLPSRKAPVAPPPPPPPMWTGFYAGVNIGGGWTANHSGNYTRYFSNSTGLDYVGGNRINSGGVVGGGQIGYNYQINNINIGNMGVLVGAEADFQGTSIGSGVNNSGPITLWTLAQANKSTASQPGIGLLYPVTRSVNIGWFGTVRGRLGLTIMPTLLVYGTGGFAYANISTNGWAQQSATQTGWTAGGGVEWMFMPNWSTKVEYLYTSVYGGNNNGYFGNYGLALNNVNNNTSWNTVRAGVDYHFNWGSTPIVAKY